MKESTAVKEARDLAICHMREIAASEPLMSDELAELEEAFRLEFIAAKARMGELQKDEFIQSYEATRHPVFPGWQLGQVDAILETESSRLSCSRCKSPHLSAHKAGFGIGRAIVGGALFGEVGLLGGFLGSRKVEVTCLECGHSWAAGEP